MKKYKNLLLGAISLVVILAIWMQGPIPQNPAYHDFADQRTLLGIPNFWNVVSNAPMFFLGLYGLIRIVRTHASKPDFASRWIPAVLVLAIFITSFGSAYYHYAPDNHTLVWDRLPMTLMFMPLFSVLIYDYYGPDWGKIALVTLVPLGLFSIWYWDYTESIGAGDLRLYAAVQFAPMIIAPAIILLSDRKPEFVRYFWIILGWYVVAKLFEYYDRQTFQSLGFWSGHTIKHLTGAVSLYYVLLLLFAWENESLKNRLILTPS